MGIENPIHLLFLGAVALLVLGPKRLPELAKALGNGIREFRESISDGEDGETPVSPNGSAPPAAASANGVPPVAEQPPVAAQPPVAEQPPAAAQPPVAEQPPAAAQPPVAEQPSAAGQAPAAEQPPVAEEPPAEGGGAPSAPPPAD